LLSVYNMIFWIIQWSLLSLIFIFLLHHLYSFFIDTLTIPKVKDLVNKPQDRYNEMFTVIQNNNKSKNIQPVENSDIKQSSDDTMHNELLDFLNNIKKNTQQINQLEGNYSLY
jgi:hypothetical protein